VTPAAEKSPTYVAVPDDDVLHFFTTELTATRVDGDDLLLKDVSISFKDRRKDIVTATGGAAAAGAALGPYGLAAGAVIGFAGTTFFEAKAGAQPTVVDKFVCDTERPRENGISTPTELTLVLPVTILLDDALVPNGDAQMNTPDKEPCWHLLPQHQLAFVRRQSGESEAQYSGNGWLYRVRLDDKPAQNSQPVDIYFGPNAVSASKADFPYSTCRKASFDIIWWRELQVAMSGNPTAPKYTYLSYSITVADPTNVGAAPLPKTGDIQFHTLCGVTTTFSKDSNPSLGSTIDEALKQIKAVQDAEKKPAAASSSTKPSATPKPGQ
jgi:hypothetical protein